MATSPTAPVSLTGVHRRGGAHLHQRSHAVGRHLPLGRRCEVLVAWESLDVAGQPPAIKNFAKIWRATDKVVLRHLRRVQRSDANQTVFTRRCPILKADVDRDISVAGPNLAAHAIKAGLVDSYHLFINPITVGGGVVFSPTPALSSNC